MVPVISCAVIISTFHSENYIPSPPYVEQWWRARIVISPSRKLVICGSPWRQEIGCRKVTSWTLCKIWFFNKKPVLMFLELILTLNCYSSRVSSWSHLIMFGKISYMNQSIDLFRRSIFTVSFIYINIIWIFSNLKVSIFQKRKIDCLNW